MFIGHLTFLLSMTNSNPNFVTKMFFSLSETFEALIIYLYMGTVGNL